MINSLKNKSKRKKQFTQKSFQKYINYTNRANIVKL